MCKIKINQTITTWEISNAHTKTIALWFACETDPPEKIDPKDKETFSNLRRKKRENPNSFENTNKKSETFLEFSVRSGVGGKEIVPSFHFSAFDSAGRDGLSLVNSSTRDSPIHWKIGYQWSRLFFGMQLAQGPPSLKQQGFHSWDGLRQYAKYFAPRRTITKYRIVGILEKGDFIYQHWFIFLLYSVF